MKLICQSCKHEFKSKNTGMPCPKCDGYAITIREYEALQRVRGIFGKIKSK